MKTKCRILDNFSLFCMLTSNNFTVSGVSKYCVNQMTAVKIHHFHTIQTCSYVRGVHGVHCSVEKNVYADLTIQA